MRLGNDTDEYVQAEERFHRMAHAHRLTLNIFHGQTSRRGDGQKGVVDYGAAPEVKDGIYGKGGAVVTDWSLETTGLCKWDCVAVDRTDPFGQPGLHWGYAQVFYPGDTSRYATKKAGKAGKDNFGYNGPIPSMRLKGYRRGSQDYEYLTMLTKLRGGDRGPADAIMEKYYLLKGNYRGVIGRTRVTAEDTYKPRAEVIRAILAAAGR